MDANQEQYHDQIDAYLRDELSNDEKILFEQSLQNNPELSAEFKIHQELFAQMDESVWITDMFTPEQEEIKEITSYFRSEEAKKLKETIEKAKANYYKTERTSILKGKWIIPVLIAASFSIFVILYSINFSESPQELYAKYNEWNDLPSLTSRSDEDQLTKGQQLFEEKKYNDSFLLFENYIQSTDEVVPATLLYAGISALELDEYKKAISYFDQLINSNAIDQSKGYWYKVLTYLKQGKKEETIQVLEIIIKDQENYNFDKANTLLKKLR
ncbi:hypothetical protein [Aquimarina litoralis]|uniref:hypothetical protein n=1 Tax=Aquimarina litoralis TaxID=584605 RepID=UPI001C56BEA6|nr:hypothetical protein [Aquimarina litoralis]MBW1297122.1 hypothetical protein [Aquimarina litoralis]